MRIYLILILSLLMFSAFSQQTDTLVIGDRKFPLSKQKVRFDHTPTIHLPQEYKEHKNALEIPFKKNNDTMYLSAYDEQSAADYMVCVIKQNYDTSKIRKIYLWSFLDTVFIDSQNFSKLTPFIKTKDRSIYFFSAKILGLNDGILTEYENKYRPTGNIFNDWNSGWNSSNYHEKTMKEQFIVTNLYYKKGLTTYYLDRQFIIIAK